MMHEEEKSDLLIVASKQANKPNGTESVERSQREREPVTHVPDSVPGKHVTAAGTRAGSCKTEEKGAVHIVVPPANRKRFPLTE
jgi:hypothetical protein